MITNEKIESKLKENNLWFHTNNYFLCRSSNLKSDFTLDKGVATKRYLVNSTENDVILIPFSTTSSNELNVDEAVYICVGDIEKIIVTPKNGIYDNLKIIQRDKVTFDIEVDCVYNTVQKEHIISFVENFNNEGIDIIRNKKKVESFETVARNTVNNTEVNGNQLVAIVMVIAICIFFFVLFMIMKDYLPYAFRSMSPTFMFFAIFFIIDFVLGVVIKLKNTQINNGNMTTMNRTTRTVKYENEEDNKNKEEKITNDENPIESDDESYGGIKRL